MNTIKTQISISGYNGEYFDGVLHQYILGNGYRAYNPALQRFTAPDSMSPFGAGGINPYLYCEGDPINHTDPTGHMLWEAEAVKTISRTVRTIVGGAELVGEATTEAGGVQVGQSVEHSVRDTGHTNYGRVSMENPGQRGVGVCGERRGPSGIPESFEDQRAINRETQNSGAFLSQRDAHTSGSRERLYKKNKHPIKKEKPYNNNYRKSDTSWSEALYAEDARFKQEIKESPIILFSRRMRRMTTRQYNMLCKAEFLTYLNNMKIHRRDEIALFSIINDFEFRRFFEY